MPNNIYQKEIDLNQKTNFTLKNHHLKTGHISGLTMSSAQERAILNSTLACLIKALTNKRTTVELRNESFVTGKVRSTGG